MEPKWHQDGVRTAKKSTNDIDPTKNSNPLVTGAVFQSKKWPTCRQVGVPNRAQIDKKVDTKIDQQKWCICGSIFGTILEDYGNKNGTKWAPKSAPKTMLPLKRKSQLNASGLVFSWVSGVEVGSQHRSKIDQKMKSRWEGVLASIFGGFWWALGAKLVTKMKPKSI